MINRSRKQTKNIYPPENGENYNIKSIEENKMPTVKDI